MGNVLEAVNTIKILIERKENEEELALHGGGRNVLSQDYKIDMLQYGFPVPRKGEQNIKVFWVAAPIVENKRLYTKPVNVGQKSGHQERMQPQSDSSAIFDCFISEPTSPTLVASAANSHCFSACIN